jgi:hypothetical protein
VGIGSHAGGRERTRRPIKISNPKCGSGSIIASCLCNVYFFAEMSAAVAGQTPSQLIHSKQLPENDFEKDPMAKRETLELCSRLLQHSGPSGAEAF